MSIISAIKSLVAGAHPFIHHYRWTCPIQGVVSTWAKTPPTSCMKCGTNHAINDVKMIDSTDPAKKIQLGLSPAISSMNQWNFTPVAGTTKLEVSMNGSLTNHASIMVFRNGATLMPGDDYSINTNTIILQHPSSDNDEFLVMRVPDPLPGPQGNVGVHVQGVQGWQGVVGAVGVQGSAAGWQGPWDGDVYGPANNIDTVGSALEDLMTSENVPPAVMKWLQKKKLAKEGKAGPQGDNNGTPVKITTPGDRLLDI